MASEKLKKWIKQKREEGISEERIRKSLEKTGYDPSILDEIDDPFDSDSSNEPSEDLFSSTGKETEGSDVGFSDDSRKERVKEISDNLDQDNSNSKNNSFDTESFSSKGKDTNEESSESSFLDSLEFSLPSFSLPLVPSLPEFNRPSTPDVSRKKIGVVFALLLVIGGGAAVYSVMPDDFNPRLALGSDIDSSTHLPTLKQLDEKYEGCPEAGVSIQNISASNGVTTLDVLVTEEAWVVVEIKKNGEIIGFSTEKVSDETQIKVNKVGDEAELRPLGCDTRYSRRDY